MLGEDLEGDHRLRAHDALELDQLAGDDLGELLVARDTDDRDVVPFAGDGIGLGDAVEIGELAAEGRQGVERERCRRTPVSICRSRRVRALSAACFGSELTRTLPSTRSSTSPAMSTT